MIRWAPFAAATALSVIFLSGPIAYLAYQSTLGPFSDLGGSFRSEVLSSIALTMISSLAAAGLSAIVGLPTAYYLARGGSRLRGLVEAALDLPAAIPHPIIGIAVLLSLGPTGPLHPLTRLLGLDGVAYTLAGLVAALFVVTMPIMVKSMLNAFRSMDPEPEIAALTLGMGRLRIFALVVIPSSLRSLAGSFMISVARAISEFGSVSIVAYYLTTPPFQGVKPASVLIWDLFESRGLGGALPASFTLLLVSLAVLILIRLSEKS